jgi:DNA-binding CsgD family transcriptional regulator
MGMAGHVRFDDVQQLLDLVEECREILASGVTPAAHFLQGLNRLTRSQVVIQGSLLFPMDRPPVVTWSHDAGWLDASVRERMHNWYMPHGVLRVDEMTEALFKRRGPVATLTRAEVISERDWDRSELRWDVHRPGALDDSLLSLSRSPKGAARVLVFKRASSEAAYNEEDRDLVHLANSKMDWIFEQPAAGSAVLDSDWTPRERRTLELLLGGASEKAAAATLGISRHTLHQYVKSIYRKLGVASRAELMAFALKEGTSDRS